MKPKLTRNLLWQDKTMGELIAASPMNIELHEVYKELVALEDVEIIPAERIFNEVYYQCTRIVYENNPEPDFEAVELDIKANVGTKMVSRLVYRMMYALLTARAGNTGEVEAVRKSLEIFSDMVTRNNHFKKFVTRYNQKSRKQIVVLTPNPVAADALKYQNVDWKEVTCGFDQEAIEMIVGLWSSKAEKKKVISYIQRCVSLLYRRPTTSAFEMEFMLKYRDVDIWLMRWKRELKDGEDAPTMCAEPAPRRLEETYANQAFLLKQKDEEIAMLRKANKELQTRNAELLSKLSNNERTDVKERSFTFSQLIDYGENHTAPEGGRVIVGMLNFLLRNAGNCTREEIEKVDGLEHKMLQPERGDSVMGNKNSFGGEAKLLNLQLPQNVSQEMLMKTLAAALNMSDLNKLQGNG